MTNLRTFDWIVVNSSAGKDSQAMLDAVVEQAREAGVVEPICCDHCGMTRKTMDSFWNDPISSICRSPNVRRKDSICCEVPEPLEVASVLESQGWTRVWCSASWDTADEIARSIAKANRPCVAATGMPALPFAVMARYRAVFEDEMERARR